MTETYFQMRIDSQTARELDYLAQLTGIGNRSGVVRLLIKQEINRRQPSQATPPYQPTQVEDRTFDE